MLQLSWADPSGTFSWNTWPTTAEESGMFVCMPSFFAEAFGIAVVGPSPTDSAAAWSSESTEDCMEASSSTDIMSTSVSCCSDTKPRAKVARSPITRGTVLYEKHLLLLVSPQLMALSL